jgi:hypothetical protein
VPQLQLQLQTPPAPSPQSTQLAAQSVCEQSASVVQDPFTTTVPELPDDEVAFDDDDVLLDDRPTEVLPLPSDSGGKFSIPTTLAQPTPERNIAAPRNTHPRFAIPGLPELAPPPSSTGHDNRTRPPRRPGARSPC